MTKHILLDLSGWKQFWRSWFNKGTAGSEKAYGGPNSGFDNTAYNKLMFQVRSVKTEFPKFDGIDLLNWICKAGQLFDY